MHKPNIEKIYRKILIDIGDERNRQDRLVKRGKFPYNCASPGVHHPAKLPIVVEELGEVATEVYEIENAISDESSQREKLHQNRLRTELIQLAAVAVAWVESIDAEQSASPLSAPSASPREK